MSGKRELEEPEGPRMSRRSSAAVAKKKVRETLLDCTPTTDGRRRTAAAETLGVCERDGCNAKLECALNISNNSCAIHSKKVSECRWFHISGAEHYCSYCHEEFYKNGKSLNDKFSRWKTLWTANSLRDPGSRVFVAEELLPFWVECVQCGKWRPIKSNYPVTPDLIQGFTCASELNAQLSDNLCKQQEKPCVPDAKTVDWLLQLSVPPLLQNSPIIHFVGDHYYYDQLGMSPTNAVYTGPPQEAGLDEIVQPFNIPDQHCIALCVRPDVMEYDEMINFPEFHSYNFSYCFVRISWLTVDKCVPYILCRGLARVRCVQEVKRILEFLTMKGIVNLGLLTNPPSNLVSLNLKPKAPKVLIIGGGISGLAAARQLKNFGLQVTVLEAKTKLGGRMKEDWSLGVAVACGAQLVTGIVNNPVILMCYQAGVAYRGVGDSCPLLDSDTGKIAEITADKRVDFHFNCLLDATAEWREKGFSDRSLKEQLAHMHRLFLSQSNLKFNNDEERILQWQLGNVEFSCGSCLDGVSALHWDQNEQFAQFGGEHALLTDGSTTLISKLAEGLDVRCNTPVTKVDYRKRNRVTVSLKNGNRMTCDIVVITVPLAVLQLGNITFDPALPEPKRKSICRMGAGIIEKVAVKFPRKFWAKKTNGADYFGHVPKDPKDRGLFNIFYDFSTKDPNSKHPSYVLMSYVCGESVNLVNEKKDAQVAEHFVETLKELFPEENIPEPDGYVVTHWLRDPCFGMSYSFQKLGSSSDDYDSIAKSVENRLYFAGEATNRFFPQTMTGAFLSGIREASKIAVQLKNKKD